MNSDFVGGVVHWKGSFLTNSHVSKAGNLSSLTLSFPNVLIMYVMEISWRINGTCVHIYGTFSPQIISLVIKNAYHQLESVQEKQKGKKEKKTNIKTKIKKHSLWILLLQLL